MTGDWPVALLILALGPAAGSFLGVVVDRWPERRSLWTASTCEACRTRLGWRDLLPILSGLRGRCRHCGAPIPPHLLRLELASLGAACLAVALGDGAAGMLAHAFFLWALVGLFYADLLHFRLPDPLNAALFAAGLWLAALTPGRWLGEALVSAVVGAGAFWAIRWLYRAWRGREGLGQGDVKLMAGIGAGLGWTALPAVTLIAAALGVLAAFGEARGRLPAATARIPFGSCLCGAAALVLLL